MKLLFGEKSKLGFRRAISAERRLHCKLMVREAWSSIEGCAYMTFFDLPVMMLGMQIWTMKHHKLSLHSPCSLEWQ